MAQIWEYIANFNPTQTYEDLLSKRLENDKAYDEGVRRHKIMSLQDAWNKGDTDALRSIGIYAPEIKKQYIENEQEMLDTTRPWAQTILQMAPEKREEGYQQMRRALRNIDFSDAPANYDEAFITTLANSDPTKIQQERQAEIARQAQQDMLNRQISLANYQRSLANKDKADQINYVESLMEAGKISPEKGLEAISAIKGVSVTPQTAAEAALDDYLKTGNPEALAVIQRQGEAAKLLSTKNTSDSAPIQANRAYDEWEAQNPDATEEEKRDERFRLNIPNGSDKVWLEKEKQRAKDNQGFLIGNGYAKDEEEANQLMGVNKASPVGQALSQETIDFLSNPLMANENYRASAMKEKGKNDAQKEKAVKAVEDSMRINLPRLIEAYDAAKSGEGVGIISGKLAGPVGKGKASKNYAKIQLMKNTILPSFLNKVVEAGGTSRNVDAGKEAEMFIPQLKNDMSSESLANLFDEVTYSLYGVHIDEARGKGYDDIMEIKQSRQMPATTKKSNPQKIWTVEEYFGEQ